MTNDKDHEDGGESDPGDPPVSVPLARRERYNRKRAWDCEPEHRSLEEETPRCKRVIDVVETESDHPHTDADGASGMDFCPKVRACQLPPRFLTLELVLVVLVVVIGHETSVGRVRALLESAANETANERAATGRHGVTRDMTRRERTPCQMRLPDTE